ncbi:MAG: nicotinate-nucleotide--dimethylbenzimidazole phosphoribosyltransferase [Dehalococcoidia bacterium]|nr:nicotinate-nucleotide--dimethylbenzimidazole phosphoribosyltransferase [Dehalococcoidia bacterium]MDZ4247188.1 nicotinate-nucleotide--dimethylbenzimidazole phosphoribosyltransferase [Dehalococcoidia bacterium]
MDSQITATIQKIKSLDEKAMDAARKRQETLTKPAGSLGRLEELSVQIAGITGKPVPRIQHKAVIVMAGDHGVVDEGVSLFPQEVTAQMVLNFLNGGAGINVLARFANARVTVVDIGVKADIPEQAGLVSRKIARGTRNMALGPAMSREQAEQAVKTGIDMVELEAARGLDIVATGDMGIGNTTASAAICSVMSGQPVEAVAGRGTGVDDQGVALKIVVIKRAVEINRPDCNDALDVLAKVGGLEIGGLAGVILGAAARGIPVVIDGFISGAAALVAVGLAPKVRPYLIPAHLSAESGHRVLLESLSLDPLLKLGMRLGEGTGAILGILLAEAATRILAEMATFGEAGVSEAP